MNWEILVVLFTYGNIFVLDEEAVEEPDDGDGGEGEGELAGHELHAPGAHHKTLHIMQAAKREMDYKSR